MKRIAAAFLATLLVCSAAHAAEVVGRHVFYNASAFDGGNPAANGADDGAIAPDKCSLLPGGPAGFSNYTSFSRGINGIMIDIASPAATPTAADFAFKVGNDPTPAAWPAAPAPVSLSVRWGAGINGATRVTIIWPDNAIEQEWLQVTVLSDPHGGHLGLTKDDVFCFGNAIGDTGNSPTSASVTPTDCVRVRNGPHTVKDAAGIDDPCDFDRDGRVSPTDYIIARNHGTNSGSALCLLTTPPLGREWYVDNVADPAEDGSQAHPFDSVQEAIDHTAAGDTVIVMPGTYKEAIRFPGYDITLRSTDPEDPAVVAATVIGDRNYFLLNSPDAVVVDNTDPGFKTWEIGIWTQSDATDAYGGTSLETTQAYSKAAWTFGDLDEPSAFFAWVWYAARRPDGGMYERPHSVGYRNSMGIPVGRVDQSQNSGQWVPVTLSPGRELLTGWGVSIYLNHESPSDVATSVDAVRFIPDGNAALEHLPATVTFSGTETAACRLAGLTITGGYCGIDGAGTAATIELNRLTGDGVAERRDDLGDWVSGCAASDCDGLVQHNTFTGNSSGGLVDCDGQIQGNTISGCGDMGLASCNGTIQDNVITGNCGGLARCNGTIRQNIISGNKGGQGGGLFDCDGVIEGNIIMNNGAWSHCDPMDDGGGLYGCDGVVKSNVIACNHGCTAGGVGRCNGQFFNNTITGNTADGYFVNNQWRSGASGLNACGGTFVDCIITDDILNPGWSYFFHCNVTGSHGSGPGWNVAIGNDGGGNIDADPAFVSANDPDGPDNVWLTADDGLRLQAGSPCIDAGDGSAATSTDILRRPRVDDLAKPNTGSGTPSYADIGAYEYQP